MNKARIAFDVFQRSLPIFLVMFALSTMSISVWAQNDSSGTLSATIKLAKAVKVGKTQLSPGDYKVTADGSQAKFQQGKKVVAQAPCTIMDLSYTAQSTQFVVDDSGRISEIQIAGKTKAIEFSY